jgi:hypothetical protein
MTLDQLGRKHGTDKSSQSGGHNYLHNYERYLSPMRNDRLVFLEIGVGGEEHADRGGQSLRMWHDYFPQALIVGVDLYKKDLPPEARIHIYQGSQTDATFLTSLVGEIGEPDVILDDASHHNLLTPRTFEILFPLLKKGGLYITEDLHTTYWEEYYQGNPDPTASGTSMAFFTQLAHQLNHEGLPAEHRDARYFGAIEYIHFYPQFVIIKKA